MYLREDGFSAECGGLGSEKYCFIKVIMPLFLPQVGMSWVNVNDSYKGPFPCQKKKTRRDGPSRKQAFPHLPSLFSTSHCRKDFLGKVYMHPIGQSNPFRKKSSLLPKKPEFLKASSCLPHHIHHRFFLGPSQTFQHLMVL